MTLSNSMVILKPFPPFAGNILGNYSVGFDPLKYV